MTTSLRVLIVDDDPVDRKMVQRHLANTSLEVSTNEASTAEECLKLLQRQPFDCILLDYRLPDMTGIEFLDELRKCTRPSWPAIVMLTGQGSEKLVVLALRNGAQDYIVKDEATPERLEEALRHAIETARAEKEAEAESRRLEELALVDSLTKVGNRNLFNLRLKHALGRAHRQQEALSILLVDLDRFKEINESLGHSIGDHVLREVARRLADSTRTADTVARLGGDEFAVILETGGTELGAHTLSMRLKQVLTRPFAATDRIVNVGVSIACATFPTGAKSLDALIQAADSAMYEAKYGSRLDREVKMRGNNH